MGWNLKIYEIHKDEVTSILLEQEAEPNPDKKAGAAGVGIIDHIEDRVVGIKSREVYETPAATCLIEAHADLEKMVHTKHENKYFITLQRKI